MRVGALWLFACGCGRIGFDPESFAAPQPVAELNSIKNDQDPTLTVDELVIVFMSERMGDADLWTATRPDSASPFSAPARIDELSVTAIEDTSPDISANGLTLYFSRSGDIMRSSRTSRSEPWGVPVVVSELSATTADRPGKVLNDDTVLYIMQFEPGRNYDLFVTRRASAAEPWGTPEPLSELTTSEQEADPRVNEAETVMYFNRRTDANTDLFAVTRDGVGDRWGEPQALDELNTPATEADAWLSTNQSTIYFSRQTADEDRNLFIARR